jgi:hypothetical protein
MPIVKKKKTFEIVCLLANRQLQNKRGFFSYFFSKYHNERAISLKSLRSGIAFIVKVSC